MDQLKRQVHRASRRIALNRFVMAFTWSLFALLCVAAVMIAVDKYKPLGLELWAWPAGAAGLALLSAGIYTWRRWPSAVDAAVEIDRRFDLRERVSSAVALTPEQLETDIGQALASDAARRVELIDVSEKFRFSVRRAAALPIVPAIIAVLIALYFEPAVDNPVEATPVATKQQKEIQKQTRVLRERFVEQKKKAEELDLPVAKDLMAKLEENVQKLPNENDPKKALVKLNDLAKELEQRRNEVGSTKKLQERLDQLKNVRPGPAKELAEAIREGDFDKAAEQLKKLREELAKGDLNKEQKEQLAKQLDEMQKQLNKMAEANQQMAEQLKKQIEQAKAAGQQDQANELQKQLEQLQKQMGQCEACNKLAQQLGDVAKAMQDGNLQQAMENLQQMEGQLNELAKQMAEMELLEQAMNQLEACKNGMCNKPGMGNKPGQGHGLGAGRGKGPRPEEETATKSYDTGVKQKLGPGGATFGGFVDGPNVVGDVTAQIQTEFNAKADGEAADPLTDQNLPRTYREHAKKYFDSLREGK